LNSLGKWIIEKGAPAQEQVDGELEDLRDNYLKTPGRALFM
jgi:hypothetical protein